MGRLQKSIGRVVPASVLSATEEAARLRSEAQADADAIRRRAHEEGLADGREAGMAQVTECLVAARADAEQLRASAGDGALALAHRMAEKIVCQTIDQNPEVLGNILGEAMARSRIRGGAVVLRVHPDDLPSVEASRARWTARAETLDGIRVVVDDAVGRYGCVVETSVGRLDARLATQLQAFENALCKAR
jgi:flagellar biosynthesis/type III secretory pathway protein FliH